MAPAEGKDWVEIGREAISIEIEGLEAVRDSLGEGFALAVEMIAACAGRVIVTGIGKSGLVGRKIAATLSSMGTPAYFLHPVEGAHGDMGMIRQGDVALAISNSGETDELNAILPSLRSLGASVVALTGGENSSLARLSDAVVLARVPREACNLNLAPTASTTAALAVGDALAVCLSQFRSFNESDFKRRHPGGALGRRLTMPLSELMHVGDLPTAAPETPLAVALETMTRGRLGFIALVEPGGKLAGVFTDGDIRRLLSRGRPGPEVMDTPMSDYMIRDPKRVRPGQSAAEALDIMESSQITVLPVVDEADHLRGMIHLHDLLGKGRVKFASDGR